MAIGAGDVSSVSFRPVKRRICQLDEANRIARVVRETSDADAHCQSKTLRGRGCAFGRRREDGLFDASSHALGSHEALQIISVEQKRGKLLTAETRRHVAGAQRRFDDYADVLQRAIPDEVAVVVINGFEMVEIHHQNAERLRRLFGARGFTSQFGKERLAGEQTRELVVAEQTLNPLLKGAVDLV